MNEHYNKKLTKNSQYLRRNMTKEERRLWYDFLKALPVTVYRQKVFGNYIADFYIAKAKIIIELDGSQHYSEGGKIRDRKRDSYFSGIDITALRYTNLEIQQNYKGVCEDILYHINLTEEQKKPSP